MHNDQPIPADGRRRAIPRSIGRERRAVPALHPRPPRLASRRAVLGGAAAVFLAGCGSRAASAPGPPAPGSTSPSGTPGHPQRIAYGGDPSQRADLHVPAGPRRAGVIVVVHGGFWLSEYGADLGTPLAQDLAARGHVVWNLEYRRIGNGGGWPETFRDVAAGIDHLRTVGGLDLSKVVAVGHSAGGQLAAWASARGAVTELDPGAASRVALTGVVCQAGVLDLAASASLHLGDDAAQQLLGGEPDVVAARYKLASPQQNLPNPVPVRCVHSHSDGNVPYAQSADYVSAATRVAGDATLTTVPGDHFSLITVGTPAWEACVARTQELLA